ncbi:MAG: ParB/RepB/Spo0J family partition protein [Rubrobacter sp.]|nr:ParB/RepB/Spo0J family partition protein [Rubrobacter sp.]
MGRRGLGRGLSALIATGESVGGLRFEELPTSAIRSNVHQPRREFPESSIKELAASIREVGILQPLVIRSTEGGFELIAGERRLRAAREAGLDRVPVLIRQAQEGESMELALVENLQREDLNPLETAAAYQALMDSFGLSREQLALRLGKSRAAVTNTLRLSQLPDSVKDLLLEGSLSEGHARALLALGEEDQMLSVAGRIQEGGLSVRRTEELVRRELEEPVATTTERANDTASDRFIDEAEQIQSSVELPTKIRATGRGGKVEIRFRGPEELQALISFLTAREQ